MFDFNKVEVFNADSCLMPDAKKLGIVTLEDQIEYAAKVSNPASQGEFKDREVGRLTKFLIDNNHWSPLEMVTVGLKIDTTRDIGRQVLRHVTFRYQEFSQRYAEVDMTKYVTKVSRSQDKKNRQNSNDDMSDKDKLWFETVQHDLYGFAAKKYNEAIEKGVAKEVARVILPEGMTPTTMFMKGTVRSWYHYCDLRCANGTQKEHMDLAIKCNNALHTVMPNLFPERKMS